jgi:hypothetical protein
MKKNRVNIFSVFLDLLIDLGLIGMGVVLYYHFMVYSLGPVGLSQVFINLVGSRLVAVLIISGLPFVVGVLSLTRLVFRTSKKLFAAPPPEKPAS